MAGNQIVTVLEADGVTQTDVEILGTARQAAANSKSIATCTEDKAVLDAISSAASRLTSSATNIAPGSALATTSFVTGGRYDSTQKTLTNGQEASYAMTARGAAIVNPGAETFNVTVNAALPAGTNNIGDVDIASALPAGTNAIGKLAANAGVNIGTVTIDSTQVAGPAVSAPATFTPAATSHAAGDCNGAAQEFALSAPSGGRIMITSATLEIATGTAKATSWSLYLYNVTPPSAIADDAPWAYASGDRASRLARIDLGTAVVEQAGVATLRVEQDLINKQIKLAGTSVFGYLVNNAVVTEEAVAHIVTLHAVPL